MLMNNEKNNQPNLFNATLWKAVALMVCWMVLTGRASASAVDSSTGIRVDGHALTRIRYPAGASETVKFAASELARYVEKVSGAKLSVAEGKPERGAMFLSTTLPKNLRLEFQTNGFDRALVVAKQGCVYLIGENDRSALYAIYDFLQDFGRIEFFGPGERHEYIPPVARLELPGTLSAKYGSAIQIRDYFVNYGWNETIDFLAKSRLNSIIISSLDKGSHPQYLAEIHKRGMLLRGPSHNMSHFLPDEALFKDHPEYFPMVDGKRVINHRTACFSNAKAEAIFLAKWRNYVREYRGFWDTVTFYPEDYADEHYCGCPVCIQQPNANWYIVLVTKAAKILEEEAPEMRFEFCAYHSLRTAPTRTVRFPSDGRNMTINLSLSYDRDAYAPIDCDIKNNQAIVSMLDGWLRYFTTCGYRGKTLMTDYYNLCEIPGIGPRSRAYLWPVDVIQKDCRFYQARGLDGVSDWVCMRALCFPTPYVLWSWMKIWSDTEVDLTKLENRFYPAYFGAAGGRVRDYIHRLTALMHVKATKVDETNITEIETLAATLKAIDTSQLSGTVRHRIEVLKVHAEYCVLLKQAFVSMASGDPAKWAPYEKQLKSFFTQTYKTVLRDEIDIPPAFGDLWWDWANRDPQSAKGFAESPTAH
jgi:hypothetical protein